MSFSLLDQYCRGLYGHTAKDSISDAEAPPHVGHVTQAPSWLFSLLPHTLKGCYPTYSWKIWPHRVFDPLSSGQPIPSQVALPIQPANSGHTIVAIKSLDAPGNCVFSWQVSCCPSCPSIPGVFHDIADLLLCSLKPKSNFQPLMV